MGAMPRPDFGPNITSSRRAKGRGLHGTGSLPSLCLRAREHGVQCLVPPMALGMLRAGLRQDFPNFLDQAAGLERFLKESGETFASKETDGFLLIVAAG